MRLQLNYPAIEDSYETELSKLSWFCRSFPSFAFYLQAWNIVNSGASLAKKGKYDDAEWANSSYRILEALEKVGVKLQVGNLRAVTSIDEPCVVVGNHMSTLETFILPYLISPHKPVTFIIKRSLVEYPVFKHIMQSRDPVVVGRENPREDLRTMLNEGVKRLQSGISLIVFPQTTRSTVFDPSQFNSIAVKIAKRAGVKIVPVALKTDAWGNGNILKDFGKIRRDLRVHFEFDSAMDITGNGSEQQKQVVQFIQEKTTFWSDVIS